MTARPTRGRTVLLAAVVFAMGCAVASVPPNRFYRLQVAPVAVAENPSSAPKLNAVLVVQRFTAAGLIDERPILYSRGRSLEVRQHHYDYWADSPTDLLHEQMVAYLRATRAASVVTTPEARVRADFVLWGRINRFEHILVDDAQHVLIETRASLKDVANRRLLFSNTYRAEVEATGRDMTATVDAFNRGVGKILGQLAHDISTR